MCRICTRDRANVQNMIVTFRGGRKRGLHLSLPAQVAAGGHDHQGAGHDVWRLRHTDGCALGKSCRGIRPVAGIPLYGPLSLSGGGSFCAEIPSPGSAVRLPLKGEPSLSKKVLTSWWTGKQAPPPLPPSPVSAKNQRFFGRGDCKETIFSLENGIFRRKNRPVPTVHAAGHD